MPSDLEILKGAIRLLEGGKRVALCTIVEKKGSGPRDVGAKMVISEDGETVGTIGGGNLEIALINKALELIREERSKKAVFSLGEGGENEAVKTGLICGGELTILIDVVKPKRRIIVVGAGHIAWPLAKLADIVGYRLIIVDDDEKLASKERFPMAEKVVTGSFAQILDEIEVTSRDFVVVVHGEPDHDYLALEKMIKKKPAYVGLLGSKTKVATLVNRLKEAGISDDDLKVLHAPIGLEIGAQTPEEIAISILAEIISKKEHSRQ